MTTRIEVKLRNLTPFDRCDRCGARAQTLVKTPAGELVLCGHHVEEHKDKIKEKGWPTNSRFDDPQTSVHNALEGL